jgi:hypothetical protein
MHLQSWRWKHWCTTAIAVSSTLLLGEPACSQAIPTSPPSIEFAQNSAAEKDLQQLPPAVRRTLEAELAQEAKAKFGKAGECFAMSRTQVTNADFASRDSVERELDERHAAAQDAFARRDLEAYRAMFSASLRYRRADGEVIDSHRLMRDVASQFRRFSAVRSSFVREQLTVTGNEVTETVDQSAAMDVTVFWILHRTWCVHRRGEYSWIKADGVWVIEKVTVLEENVTSNWHLGLRPMSD